MVELLEEYADNVEEGNYEEAFEAADAIGSDDGEGCSICEALSSSLAGSVAFAMWFPEQRVKEEVGEFAARVARGYAEDLRDELPPSPRG